MDRQIVYTGAIPEDTDLLLTNKNTMVALGFLMQAVLGTSLTVDGLACTPTGPASLNVNVGPGAIHSLQNIDGTAYGSVAADTANQIMKQGINPASLTLSCPAPATTGQSINYLIQAAYQDVDGGDEVLPYYNASNPATPYNGPNNTGVSQHTVRKGSCVINVKAGVAAATGTQTTPAPDAGYTGLYTITVANGQSTITSGNIQQLSTAPFIATKLPAMLSAIQSGAVSYAADSSGVANTITITLNPIPAALTPGMRVNVKVANSVTGATVMNVNGLGNVAVKTTNNADLPANAMVANGIYGLIYDGNHWQLQNAAQTTGNGYYYGGTTSGSANAQTLSSLTPTGFALSQGNTIAFTAGFTNTGAATFNANSTGATAVKIDTGSGLAALTGGEIVAGNAYVLYFDGTQYVLIDPSSVAFLNSPALTGTPTAPTPALTDNSSKIATTQWGTKHPGAAKAWVVFDGATGTILDSYNIASVTRNSTGDYTINLTTPMGSANYGPILSCLPASSGPSAAVSIAMQLKSGTTPTNNSFEITAWQNTATPGLEDPAYVYVSVYGNQ